MKHFPPVGQAEGKKEKVEAMFDAIAPRYDFLNRVLSFGIDQRWRRRAIELLRGEKPDRILDVATGTADLALQAMVLNPSKIVGIDISEEMLERGREKVAEKQLEEVITLRKGDCEKLPFSDNQFDAALVAFGVRNFENLPRGLAEINRVLRKDGTLVVLEFSQPSAFPIKQGYNFYSRHILPRVGSAISKDSGAYKYLPESVAAFPDGENFLSEMRQAGFKDLKAERLTFGIASLYFGRK